MPYSPPSIAAMRVMPIAGRPVLPALRLYVLDPGLRYLADEIQNAKIIAMMFTRRPTLRFAALALVLVMWIAALASLVSLFGAGRDNPTPADLIAMTVRALAPMFAGAGCGGEALRNQFE